MNTNFYSEVCFQVHAQTLSDVWVWFPCCHTSADLEEEVSSDVSSPWFSHGEHVFRTELFSVQKTMNNSSCPPINWKFSGRFLPPVYISVFVVGMLANGWGLKSLLKNWKKLGNINLFVLNLGISDVLYLLTLPFLVVYYLMKSRWIFGQTFCKVTRFCFNLNLYGSIGFLTCISVYRYLAIVHPTRTMGRITFTHSLVISVTTWLLVGIQCLPDMFYTKMTRSDTEKCFDTTEEKNVESYLKYSLGWTFTGFCIPLFVTLGCYGHMFVVLCRTNTTDKVLTRSCKKLLLILVLLFSVCYLPYHVLKNLNLWSRLLSSWKLCYKWSGGIYIARQLSRALVCLNSALNPLVYLRGDENFLAPLRRCLQRSQEAATQLSFFSTRDHPPSALWHHDFNLWVLQHLFCASEIKNY